MTRRPSARQRGRPDDDHLHLGHDRPAKRRGAHALRFPDQSRAGHVARARSACGRNAFLDDGHGLDDGPWEVFGTLLLGATMMLYDGAPDFPEPDRLWSLVDRHKVTALGISPTLMRALLRYGDEIVHRHDLSSLRKFASTGEPWNPDPWMWLFQNVGRGKLPIINYSGGTEISGGIVMGNVLTPMKPCAFSGPLPGMAADVVDENGKSVRGQVGELVIREPWIGMTRGFWQDPQRYIETYWSRFPDVWVHGDWAAVDDDGLWYILGRSDDTIKIAGKRVGPAEVESVLVAHPQVSEAAAIGVPDSIKGRGAGLLLRFEEGRKWRCRSGRRIEKERRDATSAKRSRRAKWFSWRHTKNAERKSDAPHRARRISRRKTRRYIRAGKPRVAGRNQARGAVAELGRAITP